MWVLVGWDKLIMLKWVRGLGLRDPELISSSYGLKLQWIWVQGGHQISKQFLLNKYLPLHTQEENKFGIGCRKENKFSIVMLSRRSREEILHPSRRILGSSSLTWGRLSNSNVSKPYPYVWVQTRYYISKKVLDDDYERRQWKEKSDWPQTKVTYPWEEFQEILDSHKIRCYRHFWAL